MAINGISFGNSILSSSVQSLKAQMADLQNQLTSGKKSTTYAGMGVNEGFAIAARTQLSNIAAYTDTMTKINTNIQVGNTALQALSDIGAQLQTAANSGSQALNSAGQTAGQQTAVAEFSSIVGILNTQAGDRYIFSGSTIYTQPVASSDLILNGNGAGQAGLKQVISERNQADLGTDGLGRVDISSPSTTSVSVAEDASPSVYGLKLSKVTSTLTGATVTNTPQSFDSFWDMNWNLAIDQHDTANDVVYTACLGGIYKTVNGGGAWTTVRGGNTSSYSYFTDVAVTRDSGIVYATLSSDGPQKGIWRSTDQGAPSAKVPVICALVRSRGESRTVARPPTGAPHRTSQGTAPTWTTSTSSSSATSSCRSERRVRS